MTGQLWGLALRNLRRRPRRTALSIAAIALASVTMTFLYGMMAGLQDDMAANIQRYMTGQVVVQDERLTKAVGRTLTLSLFDAAALADRIEAVPGVDHANPRVTFGASVFVDGDAVEFPFLGMDFAHDPMRLKEFLQPGGAVPAAPRQALISTGLAEKLKLRVGDSLTAVTQTLRGSSNGMTFAVTGIVQPGLGVYQTPWLFTSIDTARRFLMLGDGATSLAVTVQPGTDVPKLAQVLDAGIRSQGRTTVSARPWYEGDEIYGYMSMLKLVYGFIGLIFFALASTVIVNTMLMVVLERSKEIGTLAALGMDSRTIRNLFLAESAFLGGFGAVLGALAGSGLVVLFGWLGIDYGEALKGTNLGVSSVLRPVFEWWMPVLVFVSAVGVTVLFTLWPVKRIRKMEIVEALRGEI